MTLAEDLRNRAHQATREREYYRFVDALRKEYARAGVFDE